MILNNQYVKEIKREILKSTVRQMNWKYSRTPLSVRDTFQDTEWMPETMNST